MLLLVLGVSLVASGGSWVVANLARQHPALATALGGVFLLIVLPVVAHGLFILFFGEEAWPLRDVPPDKKKLAFAQLEQAMRLEARGDVPGALVAYQRVIAGHGGTEAAADAQRSIEALRKWTG